MKHTKMFNKLDNQRGMTLPELMLVLAIGGILIALLYPSFARGREKTKGQQLGADVVTVAADLSSAYTGNFATLTNASISSGSFLKNVATITDNGGTLTTNMGGTFSCVPNKINANNDSFACTITAVKDGACTSLGTALGKSAAALKVGGQDVKAPGKPMDAGKIACADDNTDFVAVFN